MRTTRFEFCGGVVCPVTRAGGGESWRRDSMVDARKTVESYQKSTGRGAQGIVEERDVEVNWGWTHSCAGLYLYTRLIFPFPEMSKSNRSK